MRNFRRVDEVHKAPHIMRPVGNGAPDPRRLLAPTSRVVAHGRTMAQNNHRVTQMQRSLTRICAEQK